MGTRTLIVSIGSYEAIILSGDGCGDGLCGVWGRSGIYDTDHNCINNLVGIPLVLYTIEVALA